MRTTLLGSLLDVAARNLSRGAEAVALFEAGAVYLRGTPPESRRPAGGQLPRRHAGAGHRAAPLRRARGRAAGPALLARRRRAGRLLRARRACSRRSPPRSAARRSTFEPATEPFLHPGRTAAVSIGGAPLGWLGEVHPLVCRAWDIDAAVGFEIDAAPLLAAATLGEEVFEDVTTFPAALRDLAVVVPVRDHRGDGPRDGARGRRRAAARRRGLRPLRGGAARRGQEEPGAARSSSGPPTAPSPTRRSDAAARDVDRAPS